MSVSSDPNSARFDAVSPAARVRVDPLPRPAMHLSPTQSKNTRKLTDEGVLRPVFLCRPVGLGMPSAVRLIPSPVLPNKHAAPGTVRPASRRRGHKRAPSNPCFSNGFVTHRQQRGRDAADLLKRLSRLHVRVLTHTGQDTRPLQARYEHLRRSGLTDFPEMARELARLEQEHERSVR
jgi:hypothetical protein